MAEFLSNIVFTLHILFMKLPNDKRLYPSTICYFSLSFKKYLFGCTGSQLQHSNLVVVFRIQFPDQGLNPPPCIGSLSYWTAREVPLFLFWCLCLVRKFYGLPQQWLNIFKAKCDSAVFLFLFFWFLLKEQIKTWIHKKNSETTRVGIRE